MSDNSAGTSAPSTAIPAIVCDDDAIARGVIGQILTDAGFEVIAETDSAPEAVTLIEHFGVREVVVDLSLAMGRGEDVVAAVRDEELRCRTVVFSAYISSHEALLAAGATAVIEKPDFDELETTLLAHARDIRHEPAEAAAPDRRRPSPPRERREPLFRSPSGFVPPSELEPMLEGLDDGDVVMAFEVSDVDVLQRNWGELVAADHRIALARAVRWATRADDEMAATAEGEIVVLLHRPTPDTPLAVHRRVLEAWGQAGTTGAVLAASATCRDDEPRRGTLGRALGGVRTATAGSAVTYT